MLLEISLKPVCFTMVAKIFLNPSIFSHAPLPLPTQNSPKFLSSPPLQAEGNYLFPRQHFFEKGQGNYDLLNQNSVIKYEDHSEH